MGKVNVAVDASLEGRNVLIGIEGLDTVAKALGSLQSKTPAAVKVAVNQSARQARKLMIAAAKARYAVNAAGARHLKDLKQTKTATNTSLSATLFISKMGSDLGYFEHTPTESYTGGSVFYHSPEFYRARVLTASPMGELSEEIHEKYGPVSKGFLMKFKNGHIGMVMRDLGSSSENTRTERGRPRWQTEDGKVEKLVTKTAPSATAMHSKVWPEVRDDVELYLMARLQDRVDWILAKAKAK